MSPNMLVILGCAFIPLILAFIWYHPSVFGDKWRKAVGMSEEEFSKPPGVGKLVLSLLMYFFISFGVFVLTVHQTHILALTGPDPEAMKSGVAAAFMSEYGGNFLTTSHGIAHGILACISFAIPFTLLNTLWEKKGWQYFLIEVGYWTLSLILIAIIISNYGGVSV